MHYLLPRALRTVSCDYSRVRVRLLTLIRSRIMPLRLNSELDLKALLVKNPSLKMSEALKPMRQLTNIELELESENSIQARLFSWAWANIDLAPELELMYSIPNGSNKSKSERALFQRTGLKAGMPDVALSIPSGKYHGLFIELKAAKGRISDDQRKVISQLRDQGYFVAICFSAQDAAKVVCLYLEPLYTSRGKSLQVSKL